MRDNTVRTLANWSSCILVLLMAVGTAQAQGADGAPVPMGPPPAGEPPGVCVVIDPQRDTLTEQERMAVRGLVLQAFANEKIAVNSSGTACTETYVVSNIKLGNTINVTMSGQRGARNGRSNSLDDLPNVYSQMVKSLVTGAPMVTGGGTTDRTNVTKDQSAPRRVAADSLKYVSLGYGGVIAGRFAYGPAFGFGYRKELDKIGLDISFFNFMLANDDNTNRSYGFNMELVKLIGVYYQDPTTDSTLYYGGGISYGWIAGSHDSTYYSGSGIEGHGVIGYEAFRSSTIRGFVQADLTLPFFKSTGDLYDPTGTNTAAGDRYTPTVTLVLGFGWGSSNVVRVINE